MTERRLLAIVAFLLGLLGGLLILLDAVSRLSAPFELDRVIRAAALAILGLAILVGSLLVYGRRYSSGGLVNLLLGIVVLVLAGVGLAAVLVLVSGILALIVSPEPR